MASGDTVLGALLLQRNQISRDRLSWAIGELAREMVAGNRVDLPTILRRHQLVSETHLTKGLEEASNPATAYSLDVATLKFIQQAKQAARVKYGARSPRRNATGVLIKKLSQQASPGTPNNLSQPSGLALAVPANSPLPTPQMPVPANSPLPKPQMPVPPSFQANPSGPFIQAPARNASGMLPAVNQTPARGVPPLNPNQPVSGFNAPLPTPGSGPLSAPSGLNAVPPLPTPSSGPLSAPSGMNTVPPLPTPRSGVLNQTSGMLHAVTPGLQSSRSSGDLLKSSRRTAGKRWGRYEILNELGRGAMGAVYRARDLENNGRDVAIKVLLQGIKAEGEILQRFQREARTLKRLGHPAIVGVLDDGFFQGRAYIAMEFVAGQTLDEVFKEMSLNRGIVLLETICDALAYAHEKGVVHRDLKPTNILVGNDGKPKIMDFGLAKLLDESNDLTRQGDLVGTPVFMSPEQIRGQLTALGPSADLWALGVIFYQFLTGQLPFLGNAVDEVAKAVLNRTPPSPHELKPEIPEALSQICMTLLEKEPSHRYLTASQVADDLKRFLRGQPVKLRDKSSGKKSAGKKTAGKKDKSGRSRDASQAMSAATKALVVLCALVFVALIGVAVTVVVKGQFANSKQAARINGVILKIEGEVSSLLAADADQANLVISEDSLDQNVAKLRRQIKMQLREIDDKTSREHARLIACDSALSGTVVLNRLFKQDVSSLPEAIQQLTSTDQEPLKAFSSEVETAQKTPNAFLNKAHFARVSAIASLVIGLHKDSDQATRLFTSARTTLTSHAGPWSDLALQWLDRLQLHWTGRFNAILLDSVFQTLVKQQSGVRQALSYLTMGQLIAAKNRAKATEYLEKALTEIEQTDSVSVGQVSDAEKLCVMLGLFDQLARIKIPETAAPTDLVLTRAGHWIDLSCPHDALRVLSAYKPNDSLCKAAKYWLEGQAYLLKFDANRGVGKFAKALAIAQRLENEDLEYSCAERRVFAACVLHDSTSAAANIQKYLIDFKRDLSRGKNSSHRRDCAYRMILHFSAGHLDGLLSRLVHRAGSKQNAERLFREVQKFKGRVRDIRRVHEHDEILQQQALLSFVVETQLGIRRRGRGDQTAPDDFVSYCESRIGSKDVADKYLLALKGVVDLSRKRRSDPNSQDYLPPNQRASAMMLMSNQSAGAVHAARMADWGGLSRRIHARMRLLGDRAKQLGQTEMDALPNLMRMAGIVQPVDPARWMLARQCSESAGVNPRDTQAKFGRAQYLIDPTEHSNYLFYHQFCPPGSSHENDVLRFANRSARAMPSGPSEEALSRSLPLTAEWYFKFARSKSGQAEAEKWNRNGWDHLKELYKFDPNNIRGLQVELKYGFKPNTPGHDDVTARFERCQQVLGRIAQLEGLYVNDRWEEIQSVTRETLARVPFDMRSTIAFGNAVANLKLGGYRSEEFAKAAGYARNSWQRLLIILNQLPRTMKISEVRLSVGQNGRVPFADLVQQLCYLIVHPDQQQARHLLRHVEPWIGFEQRSEGALMLFAITSYLAGAPAEAFSLAESIDWPGTKLGHTIAAPEARALKQRLAIVCRDVQAGKSTRLKLGSAKKLDSNASFLDVVLALEPQPLKQGSR